MADSISLLSGKWWALHTCIAKPSIVGVAAQHTGKQKARHSLCLALSLAQIPGKRHDSSCVLQAEFRSIIFALCYFHAALLERKKFGVGNLPNATSGIGWNMNYPFNTGDLLCCGQCASNYLENNVKVRKC